MARHAANPVVITPFRTPRVTTLQLVLLGSTFLSTIFFGAWAISEAYGQCRESLWNWDALYHLIALFFVDGENMKICDAAGDEPLGVSWQLGLARVSGVAFTFVAIFELLTSLLGHWWGCVLLGCWKDHAVIIGATPWSTALAVFLRQAGNKVVVAGEDAGGTESTIAQCHGFPFVLGPVGDEKTFAKARVKHAARVVVDLGSDPATLDVVRKIGRDRPVFAILRNASLASRLGEYGEFGGNVRLLSVAALTARDAIARHPLYTWAARSGQDRVRVLLIGYSHLGEALIRVIGTICHMPGLLPPSIVVWDGDPDAARARFESRFPQVRPENTEIAFEMPDIEAAIKDQLPFTAVLLASEDPASNFEFGAVLQQRLAEERGAAPPELVYQPDGAGAPDGYREFGSRMFAFGALEDVLATSELAGEQTESVAKTLHDRYRVPQIDNLDQAKRAEKERMKPGVLPWERLRETYRNSSRRAADHVPVKVAAAGLRVDAGPRSPGAFPRVDRAPDGLMLEELARAEHDSWWAERAFDGWRTGTRKDDRKFHNLMKGFSALDSTDAEEDRKLVREVFQLLSKGEGPRSFPDLRVGVLGVVEQKAMGSILAKARDILGDVPWTLVTDSLYAWTLAGDTPAAGGLLLLAHSAPRVLATLGGALPDAVIDLSLPLGVNRPALPQEQAQRRVRAYMAERCHLLFLAGNGHGEILEWRRDLAAIPREISTIPLPERSPRLDPFEAYRVDDTGAITRV